MAVLGLKTFDAPHNYEQDNQGKHKKMNQQKTKLTRWGTKSLSRKEGVKVKATQIGMLDDNLAVVAKLDGNSAKCEDESRQEKIKKFLKNGMNSMKGLHVVIRKGNDAASSEVAHNVRKGEVKYHSLKDPVEVMWFLRRGVDKPQMTSTVRRSIQNPRKIDKPSKRKMR